jgi:ubiquinone/menaquinone biosynthesis C-methylase UbiE
VTDNQHYLPALRFRWLTRFYDRVVGRLLKEGSLKARLVRQADIRPGARVLDIGCGTATLTVMVQRCVPDAVVVGVDGDLETLALARRKARAAALPQRFCLALAQDLPLRRDSFDRVISSLFFHHLTPTAKGAVLSAASRVLEPAGELHVLDWGKAQDPLMRVAFLMVQAFDGFATTTDSVRGRLVATAGCSGFPEFVETYRERSLFGTLSLYRGSLASRSSSPGGGQHQLMRSFP